MDIDFLKEVEQFVNLKTAVQVKKKNALERANNKLLFAYEGGMFRADSSLITFVKSHDPNRDLILLDQNSTPILIPSITDFISKVESCYYEAMNEYYQLYEQLKRERTVKKVMDNE
jgi:hypothetical protein|tara:strand:- start:1093 stop:1440 length:348 start_codon:yes stop_codon:yes gene_type:complete